MDQADLARWVEDVLIALARAKDRNGLVIVLPRDQQIAVLANAITVLTELNTDKLRDLIPISLGDLVKDVK